MKNIANWLYRKLEESIFGEVITTFTNIYNNNRIAFYTEFIISIILSIIFSGFLCLTLLNLSGYSYNIDLYNIMVSFLKYGIPAAIAIFIFIQIFIFRMIQKYASSYTVDKTRNYEKSKKGTYGTAGEMSRDDMLKTFEISPLRENTGPIFGKDPYNLNNVVTQKHPLLKINRNVFMVAGPSAGKSATFVIPLIFQIIRRGESAIISDPKSELFAICSEIAKKVGYEVRILNLNPMFLENSDPWNAMMYVGDDPDKAQVISNAIIATQIGGGGIFDFWTEGPLNLLQAIILRINIGNDYQESEKHLPQLFTYVTTYTLEEMEYDFEMLPEGHLAKAPFKIFKDGEVKVKKQVIQGLAIKLKLFNSPKLYKILSETKGSIDVLNPGRKKCLYFLGSNDQDKTMEPIISLYFTILYQELVKYADMRLDRQLPITVHMVLDEYANIGKIPDFEKKLSTVRSRNIVTYIIVQDINQLKTKHPGDTWKTVVNDCDYYLLLKTNDKDTMKWLSELSGEETVSVINRRYGKNKMQWLNTHMEEDITEGTGKRYTFTPDEIGRLADDEVFVKVSQRKIVKLKTFFWKTDHPYANKIEEILPAQHYPFWRLIEEKVEINGRIIDETFDYDNEPSIIIDLKPDEKIEIDKNYNPDKMLNVFGFGRKKKPKTVKRIPWKTKETGLVSKEESTEESTEENNEKTIVITEKKQSQTMRKDEQEPFENKETTNTKAPIRIEKVNISEAVVQNASSKNEPAITTSTVSQNTPPVQKQTKAPEAPAHSIKKETMQLKNDSPSNFLAQNFSFFDDAEEM